MTDDGNADKDYSENFSLQRPEASAKVLGALNDEADHEYEAGVQAAEARAAAEADAQQTDEAFNTWAYKYYKLSPTACKEKLEQKLNVDDEVIESAYVRLVGWVVEKVAAEHERNVISNEAALKVHEDARSTMINTGSKVVSSADAVAKAGAKLLLAMEMTEKKAKETAIENKYLGEVKMMLQSGASKEELEAKEEELLVMKIAVGDKQIAKLTEASVLGREIEAKTEELTTLNVEIDSLATERGDLKAAIENLQRATRQLVAHGH